MSHLPSSALVSWKTPCPRPPLCPTQPPPQGPAPPRPSTDNQRQAQQWEEWPGLQAAAPLPTGDTESPVGPNWVGSTTRATCQARSLPVGQWPSWPALLCTVAQPQRPQTEPHAHTGQGPSLQLLSGKSPLLGRALGDRQVFRQEVKGTSEPRLCPCIPGWPGMEGTMGPRAPRTPIGKAPSVTTRANSVPGQLLQRRVLCPQGLCAWQTSPSPGELQGRPLRRPGLASAGPTEKISQLAPALKGVTSEDLGQAAGSSRACQRLGMACHREP